MANPVLGTLNYHSYLDVDTLVKPWLRMTPTNTSYDTVLNLIAESVCVQAQRFIGGPLAPYLFTPDDGIGKFDGAASLNSGYIVLPYVPVIQIVSVTEYQGDSPVTLYEVDPGGVVGAQGNYDGYQINYKTGLITRVLGGVWNRPFFPGSNNVHISWIAGYNPIPADIIRVSLQWVAHIFRNEYQQSVAQSPTPIQEYEPSESGSDAFSGMPYAVRSVLQSYMDPGVM